LLTGAAEPPEPAARLAAVERPSRDGRRASIAATKVITGATTLPSIQQGTATTGLEVQAGDAQLAHRLATSLLLDRS
jgi:hypothetical protein